MFNEVIYFMLIIKLKIRFCYKMGKIKKLQLQE